MKAGCKEAPTVQVPTSVETPMRAGQMDLFDTETDSVPGFSVANGFRDPAFASNKTLPLHRWVPWIAGFSAQFVADCLRQYLPKASRRVPWVLDPFAGVGTTLLESFCHGLNVAGFEINPYAALATRMKLEAVNISTNRLRLFIADFEEFMKRHCNAHRGSEPHSQVPSGFSGRMQLFSSAVERKMLFGLDFIASIPESRIKDLFRLAFGSMMVNVSNYSYEPSLTRRASVGKPNVDDAPIAELLAAKLRLMLEDITWLQSRMGASRRLPKASIRERSFLSVPDKPEQAKYIDLVVTSPPYLNNYHYPRNTRPQLHWLGYATGRGYKAAREEESFGKFWQTVRCLPPKRLDFELPELEEIIKVIRSTNNDRGAYGGAGWANYVTTYFNDTYQFCRILSRLLRERGVAVIVLGNSIIQGVEVKTDHFFGKIAESCQLRFEDRLVLRKKRTGTSIIQSSVRVNKAPQKTDLYESAIILKK